MIKYLILGSNRESTADFSRTIGLPPSKLIISAEADFEIGHTSVQDIPDLKQLRQVIDRVDHVYWAMCDPGEFDCPESYHSFLDWLKDCDRQTHKIRNLKEVRHDQYRWGQSIKPRVDDMIFFGCSYTAGVGLDDIQQGYAYQMARHFDKSLLNLAVPGGSNGLIFDRFVRTDFAHEQTVVIQLTIPARLHYCFADKTLRPLILADAKSLNPSLHRSFLEIYNSSFLFYELLSKIRAMVQIARARDLKMIFWLADYKNNTSISWLDQTYFYDMNEFVPRSWIQNYLVDFGNDNLHPGIESNRILASTLCRYIETVYQ